MVGDGQCVTVLVGVLVTVAGARVVLVVSRSVCVVDVLMTSVVEVVWVGMLMQLQMLETRFEASGLSGAGVATDGLAPPTARLAAVGQTVMVAVLARDGQRTVVDAPSGSQTYEVAVTVTTGGVMVSVAATVLVSLTLIESLDDAA